MSRTKKILAMLLALILCFGLVSTAAFADNGSFDYGGSAEAKPYKIAVIGNSTTSGYALEDYGDANGAHKYGILDYCSIDSICYTFGEYVQRVLGSGYRVSSLNLTAQGMRTDELRAILDPSYVGDSFCRSHINGYNNQYLSDVGKTVYDFYAENLPGTDCIIFDAGLNNFGTYLGLRISAILTGNGKEDYSETIADLSEAELPGTKAAIETVIDTLLKVYGLDELLATELPGGGSSYKDILDTLVFCYADFCINFDKDIELLHRLCPKAKILVGGMYNMFDDLYFKVGDLNIDFGGLVASYLSLADNYITGGSPYKNSYCFADLSDGLRTFYDQLKAAKTPADVYSNTRESLYNNTLRRLGLSRAAAETLGITQDKTIACFMEAAQQNSIELSRSLPVFTENFDREALKAALIEGSLKNADASVAEALIIQTRFLSQPNIATHPSVEGCYDKLECYKAAWLKAYPASLDAEESTAGFWHNLGSTILNTFQVPLLEKINELFNSFIESFIAFWQTILGLK